MNAAGAAAAPRFGRRHCWLFLAPGLVAAASAAFLVLDWHLLWAVPAGPFGGLPHRGGFTDWSRGIGAFSRTLMLWAFLGLAVALAAQWLLPMRSTVARLVLWTAGWATWFACGVVSCLNTCG